MIHRPLLEVFCCIKQNESGSFSAIASAQDLDLKLFGKLFDEVADMWRFTSAAHGNITDAYRFARDDLCAQNLQLKTAVAQPDHCAIDQRKRKKRQPAHLTVRGSLRILARLRNSKCAPLRCRLRSRFYRPLHD